MKIDKKQKQVFYEYLIAVLKKELMFPSRLAMSNLDQKNMAMHSKRLIWFTRNSASRLDVEIGFSYVC